MSSRKFINLSQSVVVDADFEKAFRQLGLISIDDIFSFNKGHNLAKSSLPSFRSRLKFEIDSPQTALYLKRYDNPPVFAQLKNWFTARRKISFGLSDFQIAENLQTLGINTPKTVCFGQEHGAFFEKRSFSITEQIPDAQSLEKKLPPCFYSFPTSEERLQRKIFIRRLADFIRKFHNTNYRHRDLYLSHIFYSNNDSFYLIDLSRTFKPLLLAERFRIKDIAQLFYSSPSKYFSKTDRLRFYHAFTGKNRLDKKDKRFINKVIQKAKQMAIHDKKYGRIPPFEN